jgi:hypothetical protein
MSNTEKEFYRRIDDAAKEILAEFMKAHSTPVPTRAILAELIHTSVSRGVLIGTDEMIQNARREAKRRGLKI